MDNYFGNQYPYTDFHELNLDWIIKRMRKLEIDMDEFKVVNNITFSGQWDITKQYPAWTIVNDNNIGYVSIKPVPVGVVLTFVNAGCDEPSYIPVYGVALISISPTSISKLVVFVPV